MVAAFIADSTWQGVQDAKERKRIQDRLAQRARRKRLALAKATTLTDTSSTASSSSPSSSDTDSSIETIPCTALSCPSPAKFPRDGTQFVLVPLVARQDRTLQQMQLTVCSALYNNGAMLGLTCGCLIPCKSSPCQSSIPESLQPTALQLTTLHQPWIDRFPFPKMRDNMISLNRIFSEEDFLRDLFCMHSFEIKPGGAGWDPAAWIIGKDFAKKWGFLFY